LHFFEKNTQKFWNPAGGGGKFTIVSKLHKITEAIDASASCTKQTFSRRRLSIAHFQSGEQFRERHNSLYQSGTMLCLMKGG